MKLSPYMPSYFCSIVRNKVVLLEIPEGLRSYEEPLLAKLYECGARTVAVRIEPSYGACETLACSLDFDIVVHVGHVPYALKPIHVCGKTRVVYLPVVAEVDDASARHIERLAGEIESRGWRSAVIGYVYTFARHAVLLQRLLVNRGVRVVASHILGCYFGGLEKVDVDGAIVVGSRFHALGLGLAVHAEREVILYEPPLGHSEYTPEVRRVLQKRYWVASQAAEARLWGIVIGTRAAQCRPILVTLVEGLLRAAGRKVRLYISDRLCRYDLDQILDVEAFVVTSCPRLAIEDLGDYPRPVLVPGEVPYALGIAERLRFPW